MGNSQSVTKINFEDVQFAINTKQYILINTLGDGDQDCLIHGTINASQEVELFTNLIKKDNKNIRIIVYGRNCADDKLSTKVKQLADLGFYNVYVYVGGLFEWMLLQDIYGSKEFPTTKKEVDFLKYNTKKRLNVNLMLE
jgi:hypothetical protein